MLTKVLPLSAAGENNPLMPHLSEVIFGFVFLILLTILARKFVVPRFEKAYADRTQAIEGGMEAAKQAQTEAKAALDKYNAQLAEARQEAAKIREDAREQGALIIAELREQANTEAERIVTHARTQIEAERAQAVASLRSEVGTMATTLAGRIVGESLEDEARQRRTVERFLADLEASESARQAVGTDG
ncbi:F0F1 ATP synthase subunit B [Kribbella sp. CA-293567]|uniref:F0F1 ATP synthase subunit B n=1 Tax=Kribbella sp. CA-293567 TaxID=3002436 RepID=UPI0022DDAEDB|nr:F0F1 ATP synthase subunit B [Kribbella sp. CA-293567]WBQ07410.1 F0F1 ATP synthase subunit B [Kribbella sp. CA-293567]